MTIRYDSDGCIRLNNEKQDRNLAFINGQSYTNNNATTDFYTASTANLDETEIARASRTQNAIYDGVLRKSFFVRQSHVRNEVHRNSECSRVDPS